MTETPGVNVGIDRTTAESLADALLAVAHYVDGDRAQALTLLKHFSPREAAILRQLGELLHERLCATRRDSH